MDLIDVQPMRIGWGRVWQSGVDEVFKHREVPALRLVASMIGPIADLTAHALWSVYVADWQDADGKWPALTDNELLAAVFTVTNYLSMGFNVIIHCLEGKSRSTYLDCAVHMHAMGLTYDQALGFIKQQHPLAQPGPGFEAHLRNMEVVLRGKV